MKNDENQWKLMKNHQKQQKNIKKVKKSDFLFFLKFILDHLNFFWSDGKASIQSKNHILGIKTMIEL